ncbi:hypothetical protein BJ742DRAFT_735396 [Cladochytrium replicatum]|nr:hypothetical protein BJ742DRAFT_735396 [Cladochytrium replicatum]
MSSFPVGTVQLSYKRVGEVNVLAAFIPAPNSSISASLCPMEVSKNLNDVIRSNGVKRIRRSLPHFSVLPAMSNDWGQPTSSGWYTEPKPEGATWVMTEEPITRLKAEDFADSSLVYGFENGTVVPHVDTSFPPTVLVHGISDTVVPLSDSEAVLAELHSLCVKAKLFVVEGGDHYMDAGGPEVVTGLWRSG